MLNCHHLCFHTDHQFSRQLWGTCNCFLRRFHHTFVNRCYHHVHDHYSNLIFVRFNCCGGSIKIRKNSCSVIIISHVHGIVHDHEKFVGYMLTIIGSTIILIWFHSIITLIIRNICWVILNLQILNIVLEQVFSAAMEINTQWVPYIHNTKTVNILIGNRHSF